MHSRTLRSRSLVSQFLHRASFCFIAQYLNGGHFSNKYYSIIAFLLIVVREFRSQQYEELALWLNWIANVRRHPFGAALGVSLVKDVWADVG